MACSASAVSQGISSVAISAICLDVSAASWREPIADHCSRLKSRTCSALRARSVEVLSAAMRSAENWSQRSADRPTICLELSAAHWAVFSVLS